MKAAQGDFDGDRVAILPYYSKAFIPLVKELTPEPAKINFGQLNLKKRTRDELIREAVDYQNQLLEEQRIVERYGGARKIASFTNDSSEVQRKILSMANVLETILKEERKDAGWKKKINEKERELRNLKQNCVHIGLLGDSKFFEKYQELLKEFKAYPTPTYERLLWYHVAKDSFWHNLFLPVLEVS
jgi:hypothetical protein